MAGDFFLDSPQAQELYDFVRQQKNENNLFNRMMTEKQMDFQRSSAREAMSFNHKEAELNRNWQAMMSNTSHQREVQDLVAAGLNPVLSATGGNGAPVGSGATASGYANSGASATADSQAVGALTSLFQSFINADVQRDVAEIAAAATMRNYEVAAEANVASSGILAAANRYAATMSNEASHYASDQNLEGTKVSSKTSATNVGKQLAHDLFIHENYPSNLYSAVSAAINLLKPNGSGNNGLSVLKDVSNKIYDLATYKPKNKTYVSYKNTSDYRYNKIRENYKYYSGAN